MAVLYFVQRLNGEVFVRGGDYNLPDYEKVIDTLEVSDATAAAITGKEPRCRERRSILNVAYVYALENGFLSKEFEGQSDTVTALLPLVLTAARARRDREARKQ